MTEREWLASNDPGAMLFHVTRDETGYDPVRPQPDRKLRLFAVAACRAVWDGTECPQCKGRGIKILGRRGVNPAACYCTHCHGTGRVGGLTDPRSRRAVEVAEQYADGEATVREIDEAFHAALGVHPSAVVDENPPAVMATSVAIAGSVSWVNGEFVRMAELSGLLPATQAALLREVFGNPFQRMVPCKWCGREDCLGCLPEPWLRWNDGTVRRLAEGIYADRAFDRLPILHDALLDAGCDDEALLAHCRGEERCLTCGGEGKVLTVNDGVTRHWMRCDVWAKERQHMPVPRVTGELSLPHCYGSGWIPLRGPHVRGCWVIDCILGKS